MFYRLLNHLKSQQKKGVEIPPNLLSLMSKLDMLIGVSPNMRF